MSSFAVIGSGTMGNGIAHVFAQHGHDVALIDLQQAALDKALATIRANLDRQVKKGTISAEAVEQTLGRIRPTTDLQAAKDAILVVEAASENPAVKFDLFARLDGIVRPDAILASNTSSISITEIAAKTGIDQQQLAVQMSKMAKRGELIRVGVGLYQRADCVETAAQPKPAPVDVHEFASAQ